MQQFAMFSAAKCPPPRVTGAMSSVDRDICDFLDGKNDGEKVLQALYDHVLDEPIPERLLAVLKG